jgi:hypothetical protein
MRESTSSAGTPGSGIASVLMTYRARTVKGLPATSRTHAGS